jgi:hypothetical protein
VGNLLAIYLNDHLAGATGGVELARRLRASNEGDPEFGPELAEICAEIEADREALVAILDGFDVGSSRLKPLAAVLAERLGRLKLNGRLWGYSPLSRLDELELLQLGVTGKRRLWRALEHTHAGELSGFDLGALADRATGIGYALGGVLACAPWSSSDYLSHPLGVEPGDLGTSRFRHRGPTARPASCCRSGE